MPPVSQVVVGVRCEITHDQASANPSSQPGGSNRQLSIQGETPWFIQKRSSGKEYINGFATRTNLGDIGAT